MKNGFAIDTELIGMNIRARREELKMTQDVLAKKIDRGGKAQISKYERGEGFSNVDTLVRLAEALECEPDYLLGRIPYPSRQVSEIAEQIPLSRKTIEELVRLRENIENNMPYEFADGYGSVEAIEAQFLAGLLDYVLRGTLLALYSNGSLMLEKIAGLEHAIDFYQTIHSTKHIDWRVDDASRMAIEGARYEVGRELGLLVEGYIQSVLDF